MGAGRNGEVERSGAERRGGMERDGEVEWVEIRGYTVQFYREKVALGSTDLTKGRVAPSSLPALLSGFSFMCPLL